MDDGSQEYDFASDPDYIAPHGFEWMRAENGSTLHLLISDLIAARQARCGHTPARDFKWCQPIPDEIATSRRCSRCVARREPRPPRKIVWQSAYSVISQPSLSALEHEVNLFLADGYILAGGIHEGPNSWYQAVALPGCNSADTTRS